MHKKQTIEVKEKIQTFEEAIKEIYTKISSNDKKVPSPIDIYSVKKTPIYIFGKSPNEKIEFANSYHSRLKKAFESIYYIESIDISSVQIIKSTKRPMKFGLKIYNHKNRSRYHTLAVNSLEDAQLENQKSQATNKTILASFLYKKGVDLRSDFFVNLFVMNLKINEYTPIVYTVIPFTNTDGIIEMIDCDDLTNHKLNITEEITDLKHDAEDFNQNINLDPTLACFHDNLLKEESKPNYIFSRSDEKQHQEEYEMLPILSSTIKKHPLNLKDSTCRLCLEIKGRKISENTYKACYEDKKPFPLKSFTKKLFKNQSNPEQCEKEFKNCEISSKDISDKIYIPKIPADSIEYHQHIQKTAILNSNYHHSKINPSLHSSYSKEILQKNIYDPQYSTENDSNHQSRFRTDYYQYYNFTKFTDDLSPSLEDPNFLNSLAFNILLVYILGIGDRTSSNCCLTHDNRLFHIDFEFLCGSDPKKLIRNPTIYIPNFAKVELIKNQKLRQKLCNTVFSMYYQIRSNWSLITRNIKMAYSQISEGNGLISIYEEISQMRFGYSEVKNSKTSAEKDYENIFAVYEKLFCKNSRKITRNYLIRKISDYVKNDAFSPHKSYNKNNTHPNTKEEISTKKNGNPNQNNQKRNSYDQSHYNFDKFENYSNKQDKNIGSDGIGGISYLLDNFNIKNMHKSLRTYKDGLKEKAEFIFKIEDSLKNFHDQITRDWYLNTQDQKLNKPQQLNGISIKGENNLPDFDINKVLNFAESRLLLEYPISQVRFYLDNLLLREIHSLSAVAVQGICDFTRELRETMF